MKDEVKIKYLSMLFISKEFKKSFFGKNIGGTKADFERICNVSYKNKEFRKWLNELIELKVLEFFEIRKTDGGSASTYLISNKKILSLYRKIDLKGLINLAHYDYETP